MCQFLQAYMATDYYVNCHSQVYSSDLTIIVQSTNHAFGLIVIQSAT